VNYHTFWTTNSPFEGKWTELPLITPAHVKTARKIKKYFSGNLEKTIDSFPAFEGLEKHYVNTVIT
jgi:radial spoke head protein 4A